MNETIRKGHEFTVHRSNFIAPKTDPATTTTQQSSGSEQLRLYYLLVPVTPGIVSFATKSEKAVKSKKIID